MNIDNTVAAVVTGGASGLGEATARALAARGAKVAIFDLQREKGEAVAADIGGVPATHINHLTPRVLDIDDLYARMSALGIAMIPEIQGPPDWEGPDVLLRQTSFRALAEPRTFRESDGTVATGELRVRFGEVEQRGIALTAAGRDRYDTMTAEVDRRLADALYQQALAALTGSPGARAYYDQHRALGATHHQALRALAN